MLQLSGRFETDGFENKLVAKLSAASPPPLPLRRNQGYIIRDAKQAYPEGYAFYINLDESHDIQASAPVIKLSRDYNYLSDGDIIRVDPGNKSFRVLYRPTSPNNYFLVTERCNHYCLMCSQPPKNVNDSWLVQEILETIPLISPDARELGFSGGEPTLLGDEFIKILRTCKNYLPDTAIHILSNGRKFADEDFTSKYAAINHPDMMVGIPLYSDVSSIHNYVVQAEKAFDETVRGILNLKRYGQLVEIRVVTHLQTYKRLPQLADFIARNLTFVDHVTFMGLENTGFTKANMQLLWIDPIEYQHELREAVNILTAHGIRTSIYNHQLCVLDPKLWPYAQKSISDWKNDYLPQCSECSQQSNCGGFFSSTLTAHSKHIAPIPIN